MAVKIRLQRKGRTKAPFYHIVIADARAPRDGRFIEKIGTYNPLTVPATISLQNDRALYWVGVGAQPTDTVAAILRHKGVMFAKHVNMGVTKGKITQEEAEAKIAAWVEAKEKKNEGRKADVAKKKEDFRVKLDGVARIKVKPVVEEPAAEEAAAEVAAEVAEETADAVAEAPAAEEAPAADAPTEEA